MSPKLSERQLAVMKAIRQGRNGQMSADGIAAKLGYKPARSGRLAVSSTLRALDSRGFVGRIPPADQWDHATYFLLPPGRDALSEPAA